MHEAKDTIHNREQEDREGKIKNARASRMYSDTGFSSSSSASAPSLTLQAGTVTAYNYDGKKMMLGNLNRHQIAFADRPGSHDLGDMTTTNLYLGNISPTVCLMLQLMNATHIRLT